MRIETAGGDAVWLPTDVEERELDGFLENDNYCLQVKEDGIHVLASRSPSGRPVTLNRRGEVHRVPDEMVRLVSDWPEETMVDGERLHEGGFVGFDMLYACGEDLRSKPYDMRLFRLAEFVGEVNSSLFRVVETAIGTEAKRALVDRIRAANGEGVIIKDMRSKYLPGRTAWGWSMRRLKFLKSLTAILLRPMTDTKAHFEMYLYSGGGVPVKVGTVSAQQFYEQIPPGKARIGEVTYLYGTPNQKVIQPRLKRPLPWRDDKKAEDCTIDQIITGGRFATPQV